ncbi:MAG: amidohydrolase family protein [Desulforhopalus sp.]|jgi:cytosine/adenosine deaminase-related metal-dependent hydrolase|nr:amidohydrolase family protein [Desulforhopalus sp.]
MVIISAPWIVPIDIPVIQDGGIVVADGRIIDIGKRDDLVRSYPQSPETSYSCVLMPGLVNAHMHLELSHLQNSIEPLPNQKFTDWIDALITLRATNEYSREKIVETFTAALHDQYNSGVVLIGDTGNEDYEELRRLGDDFQPKVLRMLEHLGPNREACRIALEKLTQLDTRISVTGHAPYSTAPELLLEIKTRCNQLQHIFSIHTCESREEREFLRTGSGCFRDFLEKKNSWDGVFSFSESGFAGTIEYFDHLGLLDDKTLLVHCVHVSESELPLIKERGARICLCPGSNKFLDVGLAPVEQMVALGLLPALGSDSPASNKVTDIWREMQLLVKSHPNLEHSAILAMATLGGAKALRHEADVGCLSVGKKAKFIHVSSASLKRCSDVNQLIKELVSGGKPTEVEWV